MIFQGEKIGIIKPKYNSRKLKCLFFGGENLFNVPDKAIFNNNLYNLIKETLTLEKYGIRKTPFSLRRLIRMISNYDLIWGFANFLNDDIEITKVSIGKYYANGTMLVHISYLRKNIAASRDFRLPKSETIYQNGKINLSYIDKIYEKEIKMLEQKNIKTQRAEV